MDAEPGRRPHPGDAGRPPLPALLTQARDVTIETMHRRLETQGFARIRYRHGSVFRFIGEGARLTVLAERAGLTKQAVGELVDELERLGYVERVPDPVDRRAKIIRLTERGQEGRVAAARILAGIEQQWARELGVDRITLLRTTMEEILSLQRGETNAH